MANNWKKIYAMKKQAEERLLKEKPNLRNESGIYVLARNDESGLKFAYVGQAKHLIDRLVSHLIGYNQRIDISLKKRGFYDEEKRPYGWKLYIFFYSIAILDYKEKETIKMVAQGGYQLYNRTGGSQGQGKVGIYDGQTSKGYRDGLKQGYLNCLKDVKEYFAKYLEYRPKTDKECFKKDGTYKDIYLKKNAEFKNLLEREDK